MLPPGEIDQDDALQEGDEAPPPRSSKLVLWLIICGLGVLFLPLYVISTTVKTSAEELALDVENISVTLSAPPPVNPTEVTLQAAFASVQSQSKAVDSINGALKDSYVNWPMVMAALGAYDTSQMSLNSVTQTDHVLRVTGRANRELVAMAYADMLRASGLFDDVAVESITLQSIFITATPSPTVEATLEATIEPNPRATLAPVATVEVKMTDFVISMTMKKAIVNDGST